jgi:peroxiredoxin
MRRWLIAAGLYNLLWGAAVVLWPAGLLRLAELELTPAGMAIWQCLGMVIGVFGIGYLAASLDPLRHWPIVLVGLLGKIFGPIGFLWTAARGEIPWSFGWTILTNDLLWWIPFFLMLRASWQSARTAGSDEPVPTVEAALRATTDSQGRSLLDRSMETPLLLVFLRHLGCTFCREAIAEVAARRVEIERDGTRVVLLSMAPPAEFSAMLARAGAGEILHASDPDRHLYRSVGLSRGTLGQLFGLPNVRRAIGAMLRGHGIGAPIGDPLQMPGVFRVHRGRIDRTFRHRYAGDRPPYEQLACPIAPVN